METEIIVITDAWAGNFDRGVPLGNVVDNLTYDEDRLGWWGDLPSGGGAETSNTEWAMTSIGGAMIEPVVNEIP
ncbi:MAG: hypothetical protein JWN09_1744, partial [Microbacteriaceae bacterium]|nr:hypothetical protein [Microbacteriaceae bacterium]